MSPVVKKLPKVAKAKRWASVFRAAKKNGYVIVLVHRIGSVDTFFYKHAGYDLLDKEGFTVSVDGVDHMFVNTHPDPGSDINRLLARYTRFKIVTPDGHTYSYVKVKSELFDKMVGGGVKSTIQRFKIVAQELAGEKLDAKVNVDCKNGQLLKATPAATLTDSKTTDASPSGSVSKTLEAAPSGTVSGPKPSDTTPWATLTVSKASAVPVAKPSGQTPEKKPAKPAGEPATGAGQKPQAKLHSTLASRENANQLNTRPTYTRTPQPTSATQPGGKAMGKPSDSPITGNWRPIIEAAKPSEKRPSRPSTDAERMQQQAAIVFIRAQRDAVIHIINTQRANLEKSHPYIRVKASNPISCSLPVSLVQQMQSQLDREMYKCSQTATEQFLDTLLTFAQRLQREYEKYENMFTDQELAIMFCSESYAAVCDQVAGWWGTRVTMKFQKYRQGYPAQYEAPVVKGGQVTLVPARKPWTEEPHDQRKRKQTESRGTEDEAKKSKRNSSKPYLGF